MTPRKYTEEKFREELKKIHGNVYQIIGRYKGYNLPLLVKGPYGLLNFTEANFLLKCTPDIRAALNKTEYFMNMLKEAYPSIAEQITPASEYKAMKQEMLFETQFGLVKISPDALIHGHAPTIRSAVNRKDYFKNQLLNLYEGCGYEFEVDSTDRHNGRVTLICPVHGKQSVDTDGIFLGKGCPECNNHCNKSDVLYLIKLYNEFESFYKLGISYFLNGKIRRYSDYEKIGYKVEEITIRQFDDFIECRNVETRLKRVIKPFLYKPKNWPADNATECFSDSILQFIIKFLNQDIVSTSTEMQSSHNNDGRELTTHVEENVV